MPTKCFECAKGPDEVTFTWRTDRNKWRTVCIPCYSARNYSKTSRARRREKDEEGYLARNATSHLAWAHKNPDTMKENTRLCATVPSRKMKTILTSAKKRGIDVNMEDIEDMRNKLSLECDYCGFMPNDYESLNGLDRVDSDIGYTSVNTVSCCAACNAMKGPLDTDVFFTNVRNINAFSECSFDVDAPRERLPAFGGRAELREAPKKEKANFLTKENKIELWSSSCYLCGQSPAFGIDRVDANGDYTVENSKPCCTDCNYMKKDMDLDDFKTQIAHIAEHTKMWTLGDITDKPMITFGGKIREPVAVLDNGARIIFPSGGVAGTMMGIAGNQIIKSIQNGTKCKGRNWSRATVSEFRKQSGIVGINKRVLKVLKG